ncbi:MAG: 2-isopropylmalate synthase [Bacteroidia bacterium]|nr:2-isopropylmalate synthase [Bacteroidia bacterium]
MKRSNIGKYRPFQPVRLPDRTWPDKQITKAPIWCSVDLRDGNQALPIPMNIEEKVEMFKMLVNIGFKEIEAGFPSASDTEFNFIRRLVNDNLIPDDVTIQVLVQAREPLIRKTFESLAGVKKAIVHLYNSTSPLQRKVTFRDASKDDIKNIATEAATLIQSLIPQSGDTDIRLQYSPESFSDTEIDFALEVCEAVMDVWQPTEDRPVILNLPATVEWNTPNTYADQIEWFCRNMKDRNKAIISLHTHNDRGTGIAATELGLLAGADRVEGTLFGSGERTGNLDIVVVALNMNSHGIDSGLDFSNLAEITQVFERTTRMKIADRQPYAGELVFTAFSGSHQDAIKKGMDIMKKADPDTYTWGVPYLTIDPPDIGRSYEAIIRINSQSGKGGVAFILDREFALDLPKSMHPEVGNFINNKADELGKELDIDEIKEYFDDEFVERNDELKLVQFFTVRDEQDPEVEHASIEVIYKGEPMIINGNGNGPLNALVHAMHLEGWKNFDLIDYRSHSVGLGSATESATYIQVIHKDSRKTYWGCGINTNIRRAGLLALISAYNRMNGYESKSELSSQKVEKSRKPM